MMMIRLLLPEKDDIESRHDEPSQSVVSLDSALVDVDQHPAH